MRTITNYTATSVPRLISTDLLNLCPADCQHDDCGLLKWLEEFRGKRDNMQQGKAPKESKPKIAKEPKAQARSRTKSVDTSDLFD